MKCQKLILEKGNDLKETIFVAIKYQRANDKMLNVISVVEKHRNRINNICFTIRQNRKQNNKLQHLLRYSSLRTFFFEWNASLFAKFRKINEICVLETALKSNLKRN